METQTIASGAIGAGIMGVLYVLKKTLQHFVCKINGINIEVTNETQEAEPRNNRPHTKECNRQTNT